MVIVPIALIGRIIPTHAGSTSRSRDHPHMRGEHFPNILMSLYRKGSAPHAWGARPERLSTPFLTGIIPTCVGSTEEPTAQCISRGDHPHMRGEHHCTSYKLSAFMGSSPHAWGAQHAFDDYAGEERIIPTCVGSTLTLRPPRRLKRDHPHMRGEHADFQYGPLTAQGSSPHAWGAHSTNRLIRPFSIPATSLFIGCHQPIPARLSSGRTRTPWTGPSHDPDHAGKHPHQ